MRYRLIFIVLSLVAWTSCYDEDALVPTETSEFNYTLPQGDHDYDTKIVDWNERCGFYVLYKFEPRDIYWNIRNWLETGTTEMAGNKFIVTPADEACIGRLLDVFERRFLNFYPDTMLRRCMPLKVLLCSDLHEDFYGTPVERSIRFGLDFLALNGANENFQTKTPHQIDLLKDTVNLSFIYRLTENEKIALSEEFLSVSSYKEKTVSNEEMYGWGYIVSSSYYPKEKNNDWKEYLQAIIKNPYDYLNAEPVAGDTSFKGILHEKKDVNKKIRQKYDILIRYFKSEYGVDLQAIGNSKEPIRE